MVYERLDIQAGGVRDSLPIDYTKCALQGNDFVTDTYIASLKPGVAVIMDAAGYIKPAGGAATDVVIGFLVNDVAGYVNQNVNARANGLVAVVSGNGTRFATDNVKDTDIKAGDLLYAGTGGVLTKTKGTLETPLAVALNANSATSKTVVVKTLV